MGDYGENYSTMEKLTMQNTERLLDGLKRVNKSILALHRAVSAQQVVDRLAQIADAAAIQRVVVKEDADGWE